jgi:hypothetical protein
MRKESTSLRIFPRISNNGTKTSTRGNSRNPCTTRPAPKLRMVPNGTIDSQGFILANRSAVCPAFRSIGKLCVYACIINFSIASRYITLLLLRGISVMPADAIRPRAQSMQCSVGGLQIPRLAG